MSFSEDRKKIIESQYGFLNPMQQKAVFSTNGALLILAGAGSGKTTVLVNKIEFAIKYGNAYYGNEREQSLTDMDKMLVESYAAEPSEDLKEYVEDLIAENRVAPYGILAFTFTNKAAQELKDRLNAKLGEAGLDIWAGTFHSVCVRILRRHIDRIGYDTEFTIYDADDQKKIIREIIKELKLEEKMFPPSSVLAIISKAKDKMQSAADFEKTAHFDYRIECISRIYTMYEKRLKDANALDFDDLILLTVRLLEEDEEIREYWQKKFTHVYVDEFQDTNLLQYRLVRLLSDGTKNLTVVGDDDQSIYKFRGATIENILHFEEDYPTAKTIRLEQNYRSTSVILDAANTLIAHNEERKGKTLWTAKKGGDKIVRCSVENEYDEARYISDEIQNLASKGYEYSDFAVLYRNNSQSNALEDAIRKSGIPYRVIKGLKFYDRAEIKDVVAYLSVLVNPSDNLRLKRIINEPKRGIGKTTIDAVEDIASRMGLSMYEVILHADSYEQISRVSDKLLAFAQMMERFKEREDTEDLLPSQLVREVIEKTGYKTYCEELDEKDGRDRAENVESFVAGVENYETNADEPTLLGFLQEVSLVSELDEMDTDGKFVSLLTMHSAKGLEYPVVFITGMEEGVFPSIRSIEEAGGLEEERRLAYVAITRAMQKLYITNANTRRSYYGTDYHMPSRFLKEIPTEDIEEIQKARPANVRSYYAGGFDRSENAFTSKTSIVKRTAAITNKGEVKAASVQFASGDRVAHAIFGKGTVASIRAMGGDALIEVDFDSGVKKKLMQNFAKLEKI